MISTGEAAINFEVSWRVVKGSSWSKLGKKKLGYLHSRPYRIETRSVLTVLRVEDQQVCQTCDLHTVSGTLTESCNRGGKFEKRLTMNFPLT